MKEEKLWHLISLKLSGEANSSDLAELDDLLQEEPALNFKVRLLEDFWRSKHASTVNAENAFDKHLQRLSNHLSSPTLQYEENQVLEEDEPAEITIKRRKYFLYFSVAASLILAIAAFLLINKNEVATKAPENIVSTKPASKSKITLPDGSQVWLNSESKITYREDFGNNTRELELTGEAFFDVVKDKAKPFIIHTNSIDVKVLGTSFNVRSYPNEKTVETSLIRGIVEVTIRNNPDKKIILRPNEKLIVQNTDRRERINAATVTSEEEPYLSISKLHYFPGDSSAIETSWIKNKLAFDSESLEVVAGKIERWYGVEIKIEDEKLNDAKYTGVFEDESLVEVLNALKLTGNFSYTINKRQIVIK